MKLHPLLALFANLVITLPWLLLWLIGTLAAALSLFFDLIEGAAFAAFNWLDTLLEEEKHER